MTAPFPISTTSTSARSKAPPPRCASPRSQAVLESLAERIAEQAIAFDLECSSRTVEVHRAAHLMAKLEAHSLSEALRIAFAAGLGRKPE
ncbi:LuxR C-terminal-related transcriptional regulator [Caulobacter segnis]